VHTRLLAEALEKWHTELIRTRKALKAAATWLNNALARAWRAFMWHFHEQKRLRVVAAKVRLVNAFSACVQTCVAVREIPELNLTFAHSFLFALTNHCRCWVTG